MNVKNRKKVIFCIAFGTKWIIERNIAVNNDLSLVLLSQQNRSGDGLDSIFGSSRVSQISDVVFQVSIDDIVSDDVKMAEFNFLKNRNGPLGTIQNHYYPKYLRFV